jgi:hypothetical protein
MCKAVSVRLSPEPESARRARESLEPLREWMEGHVYVDLQLLVNELLVDALDPGVASNGNAIEVRAELRRGMAHVELTQEGSAYRLYSYKPEPGQPGWALYLVARLARRWGLRRELRRASVWLEMPVEQNPTFDS